MPVVIGGQNIILHENERIITRRLTAADCGEFTELVRSSRDFLHPWIDLPESVAEFDNYVKRFDGDAAEAILLCARTSGAIVGTVSINHIAREPYQRGILGYNAFAMTARQGYLSEGLPLVFRFAFADLGLHRLEADIQPDNYASLRLASRAGMRREGFSPGFIRIKGTWKDHERWAITSDDYQRHGVMADVP